MVDRKYIRKRLNYTRNALQAHAETIVELAKEYLILAENNNEYARIADALFIVAETLDVAKNLIDKVLETI